MVEDESVVVLNDPSAQFSREDGRCLQPETDDGKFLQSETDDGKFLQSETDDGKCLQSQTTGKLHSIIINLSSSMA